MGSSEGFRLFQPACSSRTNHDGGKGRFQPGKFAHGSQSQVIRVIATEGDEDARRAGGDLSFQMVEIPPQHHVIRPRQNTAVTFHVIGHILGSRILVDHQIGGKKRAA